MQNNCFKENNIKNEFNCKYHYRNTRTNIDSMNDSDSDSCTLLRNKISNFNINMNSNAGINEEKYELKSKNDNKMMDCDDIDLQNNNSNSNDTNNSDNTSTKNIIKYIDDIKITKIMSNNVNNNSNKKNIYKYELKAYNPTKTLYHKGYKLTSKITNTLQGYIYKGINKSGKNIIIKMSNRFLYQKGIAIVNGEMFRVNENIIKEARIMRMIDANKPPINCYVKLLDTFRDNKYYYIIMNNAGINLFKWVCNKHDLIKNNELLLLKYKKMVNIIFTKLIVFFNWFHDELYCCHLDISLENLLLKEKIIYKNNKKCINFEIKVCDFGLTQIFNRDKNNKISFKCNKYVGKKLYKSPEIYSKNGYFDARSADVWSLGVCLYMLLINSPPFTEANLKCQYFKCIIQGKLEYVLKKWNKIHYVNHYSIDLFNKIFVYENKRINIQNILIHPYIANILKT